MLTAAEAGLAQAADTGLLQAAQSSRRVLLTRDRDFGQLVFVANTGAGIIYLRMMPQEQDAVHQELVGVLNQYSEDKLLSSFVVIEPGRHRIRRFMPGP